ncbi:unnamed protein product [Malus baccata var. baccata]
MGITPYPLTFGQDAMLPMEINVSSVRIQNQFGLHSEEYIEAMCQGIEDLDVARIEALNQIQEGKRVVAQAYNKKVKLKSFKEGDLVWKAILPLGAQLRGFGKWSPTWEGIVILKKMEDKTGFGVKRSSVCSSTIQEDIKIKAVKVMFIHFDKLVKFTFNSGAVIGLCGLDGPDRRPSLPAFTRCDGEV